MPSVVRSDGGRSVVALSSVRLADRDLALPRHIDGKGLISPTESTDSLPSMPAHCFSASSDSLPSVLSSTDNLVVVESLPKASASSFKSRASMTTIARARLMALPLRLAGVALNLVGLARVSSAYESHWAGILWVQVTLMAVAGILIMLIAMRAAACPSLLRREVDDASAASYGAALAALQLLGAQMASCTLFASKFNLAGRLLLHGGCFLQWAHAAVFLRNEWRRGARPTPYWFPATVGCATIAICADNAWSQLMVLAGLSLGALITLTTYPICACRCLKDRTLSADPSWWLMLAPVPFMTLASLQSATLYAPAALRGTSCFASVSVSADGTSTVARAPIRPPTAAAIAVASFGALNVISLLIAIFGGIQRQRPLRQWLHPSHAAPWITTTFPTVSVAAVAHALATRACLPFPLGFIPAGVLLALAVAIAVPIDTLLVTQAIRTLWCGPSSVAAGGIKRGVAWHAAHVRMRVSPRPERWRPTTSQLSHPSCRPRFSWLVGLVRRTQVTTPSAIGARPSVR